MEKGGKMLILEISEERYVVNFIKKIVQEDIDKIFLNKRKKDRLTYTLYHELGHLSKAIMEGFSLTYMRVGNRIVYWREGEYFTIKVKNKNPKAGGCSIIRDCLSDDESSKISRLQSVVLAGGEVTESVVDIFNLSQSVSRKVLEYYPIPYNEGNPKFMERSKVVGTDPWLYVSLETNPDLAIELFECYERIARFIDTGEEKYLENCGFLKEEIPNIQSIYEKKGEPLNDLYDKIVSRN